MFFNIDASDTTVTLQATAAPKSLLPMVWQKQVEVVHNSHCKVQIHRRLSSPIPLSSVLGLLVGCLRLLGTQQIGSLMPTYHKLQACTCPKITQSFQISMIRYPAQTSESMSILLFEVGGVPKSPSSLNQDPRKGP